MAGKKHNKKLPKDAVSEQEIDPKYGYVHGEWDALGGHHFVYANPEEPKKFYAEKLNASGSYQTTQQDDNDKEIHTSLYPGQHRGYYAGGKSTHTDAHIDINAEKTGRLEVGADFGHAIKKNYIRGTGGKEIKIKGNEAHVTAQSSGGVSSEGYSQTKRQKFGGDLFQHVEQNHVIMGEGIQASVFKKDVSMYAGENYDVHVKEKGKIETKSTFLLQTGNDASVNSAAKVLITASSVANVKAQEINLKADSKITLTVGGSSITIESGSITIKSPQIKFEQG